MAKIVWVLGAGFSRPLGGPLLTELLGPTSRERLLAAFPDSNAKPSYARLYERMAGKVRQLYLKHGKGASAEHWRDAEEFLDLLDTAAADRQAASREDLSNPTRLAARELMSRLVGSEYAGQLGPLANSARRLMAAECSSFLVGADRKSEKWDPYRRWEEMLTGDDSVITFNYDLVIETLSRGRDTVHSGAEVVLPGCPRRSISKALVYKLHGSVDWERLSSGQVKLADRDDFAMVCEDEQMVIASPGPSKKTETEKLEPLWEGAERALREADAIVFVGYRFPPTDSIARRRMLGAIAGREPRQPLNVYTILGDDERAARRVATMVSYALGLSSRRTTSSSLSNYGIATDPLFAQDFLDLFKRDRLTGSYLLPMRDH